jgi:hypothetical protein
VEQHHATVDMAGRPALLPVSHGHLVAGGREPGMRGRQGSSHKPIAQRTPLGGYGASAELML